MRSKLHNLLNSKSVSLFIYWLIVINVISIILESYAVLRNDYKELFFSFEVFSVIVFTLEYLLRIYVAPIDYPNQSRIRARIRFIKSGYGLIDLLAILPFYLPLIFVLDLRILRIMRLIRLLRVFKIGRHSKALRTILEVLKETRSELSITFFVAFIMLLLSSTLMYYFEHDVQPENFASIGHAFWWAIATLTTVGYGDVYPITVIGKILAGVTALIGIGFLALPTGIISSAFVDKIKDAKQNTDCVCSNCGHPLDK